MHAFCVNVMLRSLCKDEWLCYMFYSTSTTIHEYRVYQEGPL
jgi:hypothetical protein